MRPEDLLGTSFEKSPNRSKAKGSSRKEGSLDDFINKSNKTSGSEALDFEDFGVLGDEEVLPTGFKNKKGKKGKKGKENNSKGGVVQLNSVSKRRTSEEIDQVRLEDIGYIDKKGSSGTVDSTKSFWLWIGGYKTNIMMEETGSTIKDIKIFQMIRVFKTLTAFVAPIIICFVFNTWYPLPFAFVLAGLFWMMDYLKVVRFHSFFKFKRQLDFNKFVRKLMPYLRGTDVVLYRALNKMKNRIPDGQTRTALITLITMLNTKTGSIEPFEEFAESASGEERSLLIMQTLYDYQRSSNDSSTIHELGKLVDEELDRSIDEIIRRKDAKFEFEPLMLAYCFMIVLGGYFGALLFDQAVMIRGTM